MDGICKNCPYFDGFGCDRSPVVKEDDEQMACDEFNPVAEQVDARQTCRD